MSSNHPGLHETKFQNKDNCNKELSQTHKALLLCTQVRKFTKANFQAIEMAVIQSNGD